MAQPVALQRDFGFELLAAQVAEVTPLAVVPVHVGLQVVPAAAGVVAQVAGVRLQTCTRGGGGARHTSGLDSRPRGSPFRVNQGETIEPGAHFKCLASRSETSDGREAGLK